MFLPFIYFYLFQNPWICDCTEDFLDFHTWLKVNVNNITDIGDVNCSIGSDVKVDINDTEIPVSRGSQ